MRSTKGQKTFTYIHWYILHLYAIQWHCFINIKPDSIKISILGMFVLIKYRSEWSSNTEDNFKSLEQMHIAWNGWECEWEIILLEGI